ncbi:MAG: sigma-70 family RNA polymerase sigma factor [Acidobacteria bacterium]|nr:MAG: sigma-70 family RNA polymerase sigma factor [Acidobacteriota bacterium]
MNDFHDLYVRYAADVHRFVTYPSGDPTMADDITSETFLRAWTSAAAIREATVKAYLFTIARNLYFAEARRTSGHADLAEEIPSPEPSVADRAEHRASLDRVLKALRGLPAIDRAALLLRTRDELSYEDIAAALDLSLSNAKVKVHRARMKLATLA